MIWATPSHELLRRKDTALFTPHSECSPKLIQLIEPTMTLVNLMNNCDHCVLSRHGRYRHRVTCEPEDQIRKKMSKHDWVCRRFIDPPKPENLYLLMPLPRTCMCGFAGVGRNLSLPSGCLWPVETQCFKKPTRPSHLSIALKIPLTINHHWAECAVCDFASSQFRKKILLRTCDYCFLLFISNFYPDLVFRISSIKQLIVVAKQSHHRHAVNLNSWQWKF